MPGTDMRILDTQAQQRGCVFVHQSEQGLDCEEVQSVFKEQAASAQGGVQGTSSRMSWPQGGLAGQGRGLLLLLTKTRARRGVHRAVA